MTKRLFAAIDLPETIQSSLLRLDPGIPGARWVERGQVHLTLGFFGSATPEAEEKVRQLLSAIRFGGFILPVRGIGSFPAKGTPTIICIGVGTGHPHLFQIHKRVQEAALGAALEADLRPWHPHITLARCRDVPQQPIRKFLRDVSEFDAGMFRVEAFHLYASRWGAGGSVYTRECTVDSRSSAGPT